MGSSVFRCLAVPDDEREEADLDLPSVRQSCQIRRPHGRRILPGGDKGKEGGAGGPWNSKCGGGNPTTNSFREPCRPGMKWIGVPSRMIKVMFGAIMMY